MMVDNPLVTLTVVGWFGLWQAPSAAGAIDTDARHDATVEAIEKVLPSVVNIATATVIQYHDFYDDLLRQFYGMNRPAREIMEAGSGVIIDEEGYVLTNLHVVRGASKVQVKLSDESIYDAEPQFVATTQKDVALLKIRLRPGEKRTFQAIKLAMDDDLLLGETVLALGNPYGLGGSVSRGILSSKNRRPASGNEPLNVEDWLQTDASINPGNSGGALINLKGELIGINVAVYRQEQGMGVGFAIPVKQISAALADFFAPEVTDALWFGARVGGSGLALLVSSVQPGSPAEKAGLRIGQRVLQVNNQPVKSVMQFNRLLTGAANNAAVLQVEQNGERRTVKVQLVRFDELINQKLGLVLLNIKPENVARTQTRVVESLFIEDVKPNSPAEKARLKRGFLLVAIDGRAAGSLIAVADVLSAKKPGDEVALTVVMPQRIGFNYVGREVTVNVTVR